MVIDYLEAISLRSWGFFLEDSKDKLKFDDLLGNDLSEKTSSFEEEKNFLIIKKDAAESFIDTINKATKLYGDIKDFGDELIKAKYSSHTNSDIPVLISLSDISNLSRITINRRKENFGNDILFKRMGEDLAELEKISTQIHKMGGFSIPNEKMKEVMKMVNKNNLISYDIELFQKIEKNLSEVSVKNQIRRKI